MQICTLLHQICRILSAADIANLQELTKQPCPDFVSTARCTDVGFRATGQLWRSQPVNGGSTGSPHHRHRIGGTAVECITPILESQRLQQQFFPVLFHPWTWWYRYGSIYLSVWFCVSMMWRRFGTLCYTPWCGVYMVSYTTWCSIDMVPHILFCMLLCNYGTK